ncbi:unnamed protein product, partial [marine sediment metagenome]
SEFFIPDFSIHSFEAFIAEENSIFKSCSTQFGFGYMHSYS